MLGDKAKQYVEGMKFGGKDLCGPWKVEDKECVLLWTRASSHCIWRRGRGDDPAVSLPVCSQRVPSRVGVGLGQRIRRRSLTGEDLWDLWETGVVVVLAEQHSEELGMRLWDCIWRSSGRGEEKWSAYLFPRTEWPPGFF